MAQEAKRLIGEGARRFWAAKREAAACGQREAPQGIPRVKTTPSGSVRKNALMEFLIIGLRMAVTDNTGIDERFEELLRKVASYGLCGTS